MKNGLLKLISALLLMLLVNIAESAPTALILQIVGATSTTITLRWVAPIPSVGTLVSNDLRQSTAPITASSWLTNRSKIVVPIFAPGTSQSVTVCGLRPSTTYYFALKVKDTAGWSAMSNQAITPTQGSTPFVNLAWDHPVNNPYAEIVGYLVFWDTNSANYNSKTDPDSILNGFKSDVGFTTNCIITGGLVEGVTNFFTVVSYTADGRTSGFAGPVWTNRFNYR